MLKCEHCEERFCGAHAAMLCECITCDDVICSKCVGGTCANCFDVFMCETCAGCTVCDSCQEILCGYCDTPVVTCSKCDNELCNACKEGGICTRCDT